jgi:hypothetical protein
MRVQISPLATFPLATCELPQAILGPHSRSGSQSHGRLHLRRLARAILNPHGRSASQSHGRLHLQRLARAILNPHGRHPRGSQSHLPDSKIWSHANKVVFYPMYRYIYATNSQDWLKPKTENPMRCSTRATKPIGLRATLYSERYSSSDQSDTSSGSVPRLSS